jgi:hypothetical protein
VSNDTPTNAIAMPKYNILILLIFILLSFVAKVTIRQKYNNHQAGVERDDPDFLLPSQRKNKEIFQTADC